MSALPTPTAGPRAPRPLNPPAAHAGDTGDDGPWISEFMRRNGHATHSIVEYDLGVAARNFRIDSDAGPFVLRYDARRSATLAAEDQLFCELARRGGVRAPVGPWRYGEIDGVTAILRPWIGGEALPDRPPALWPSAQRLGRLLGRLHRLPPPPPKRGYFFSWILDPAHARWAEARDAAASLGLCGADGATVDHAVRRSLEAAQSVALMRASPVGVTHGDFTPGNVLVDGRRVWLIDWEKACVGPLCADLAQAIYYFCAVTADPLRFAQSFLAAYGRSHRLDARLLSAWLRVFPTAVFLWDANSTAVNRRSAPEQFSAKKERYFAEVSLRRYARFCEIEARLQARLTELLNPI